MENKKLEDIPARMSVFVDTNILIYHLLEDELYGESCKKFLKRVEEKDVKAFISPVVISETLFLYLRFWVIKEKNIIPKKILEYPKQSRDLIKEVNFQKPQKLIFLFKLLPVGSGVLKTSYKMIKIHNLLPNDAINIALVNRHKIPAIATLDDDFDDIEGIEVFKPSFLRGAQ
ncbi:MAG: PIN domain protein [Candidatus Scalindua rubra]|uniref:PIN domain protein n=1 Tax=Candidatus Scalindua rubra TaxID=1872076 RepID=A0A1E3X5V6_9BACT|nr:MAG: PIN domain protein [Candidatus Scalindua rubra]